MKSVLSKQRGFTLIELLVVIAIIALLLSMLLPSLQTVKKIAQGVICRNNTKALSMGAILFAQDNKDALPQATPSNIEDLTKQDIDTKGWVTKPNSVTKVTISPMENATVQDRIRGVQGGTLYRYIEDHKAYHCPGDKRYKDTYNNYLSFSMPSCIRPDKSTPADRDKYITKIIQISLPSSKYLFVAESDPRAYYSGSWSLGTKEQGADGWHDGLAIWHNEASTFGFADGHGEAHKWRDEYTKIRAAWSLADLVAKGGNYGYIAWPAAEYQGVRNDLDWIQAAWPYSR